MTPVRLRLGSIAASIGHLFELGEEAQAGGGRQSGEHFVLQLLSESAELLKPSSPGGREFEAAGASVPWIRPAGQQMLALHAAHKRGNGVWIAAHGPGEFGLCQAILIRFGEVSQNRELIRRAPGMRDAAAEGLIQAIPSPAEKHWESPRLF
jgi:hypothetical protein